MKRDKFLSFLTVVLFMSLPLSVRSTTRQNVSAVSQYDYTLPFFTGFEESDEIPVIFPPSSGTDETAAYVTDFLYVYAGERSVALPPSTIVSIPDVPIQKGATYLFECTLRGYDTYYNPFVYPPYSPINLLLGNSKYTISESKSMGWSTVRFLIPADTTARLPLSLKSGSEDYYYIDNLSFSMYTSPKAPGAVSDVRIIPAPEGILKATVQWTNPSLDASGEALEDLAGIIIDRCPNAYFFENVITDTILSTTPGASMSKEMDMPGSGKWYFRFSCYNQTEPSPLYMLEESDWIGNDPVLGAPQNIRIVSHTDGSSTISWDETEETGSHGGFLGGKRTGYMAVRTPVSGGARDTIYTTATSCTFESAPLNLYTFTVCGIKDELEPGEKASLISVVGNTTAQITAIHAKNNIQSDHSPLNLSKAYWGGCSNKASVNQIILDSSSFSAPCLIDSLILFMETKLNNAVEQEYSIYLGLTDKKSLSSSSDLIPLGNLKKVFDGKITLNKGETVTVIPHIPFFYDKTANLVVSVVRKKQTVSSEVKFYANYEMNVRSQAYLTSDNDFPITREPLSGNFFGSSYEPVLVFGVMTRTNSIKGTVKDINGESLDSVAITIRNKDAGTPDFTYMIMTDEQGAYSFDYLPDGEFTITFSHKGLSDATAEIAVENKMTETRDIILYPSAKIRVSGTVIDHNQKRIAGADIRFSGTVDYRTATQEDGSFTIPDMYGSTVYHLNVSHPDFETFTSEIKAGDTNIDYGEIKLDYLARPVSRIEVRMKNKTPEIAWRVPLTVNQEVIGALNSMQTKNSIGFRGQEIMAAATFEKDIIDSLNVDRLVKVKFYAGDTTAVYTIKIFKGEKLDQEIYSKKIGKLGEGWFETFLDTPVQLDNEGVRVAVHVAEGYHHKPIGYDEGPATVNGSALWVEGTWYDISYIGHYNGNWNIIAVFGETETKPAANGYRLYRGNENQKNDPDTWELVAEHIQDTVYTDAAWPELYSGRYFYAVCADYFNDHISDPLCSETLEKDMYHKVVFEIENNAEKQGACKVFLDSKEHVYQQENADGNRIILENVYHGSYTLKAGKDGFYPYVCPIEILQDTTVRIRVEENLYDPILTMLSIDKNTVALKWTMDNFIPFFDDMESYPDWSIDGYGDYILTGLQKKRTLSINGSSVLWPNQNTEQSFIVFNPKTTNPALTQANWQPHSGTRMLTAMFGALTGNYDCLVKPIRGGGTLSFWTYGVTYDGKPETFRVLYSDEEEFNDRSFKTLHTERQLESWPEWTLWKFEIPEEACYFAVNYTSDDIFALHIDDISYEKPFIEATPVQYEIYLNGSRIATLGNDISSYTLTDVPQGQNTVGLKAVYVSGTSATVEESVVITEVATESRDEWDNITVQVHSGTIFLSGEWVSAALYDLTGKQISTNYRPSDRIDVSDLPAGIYLVVIQDTENRTSVKKVVVR